MTQKEFASSLNQLISPKEVSKTTYHQEFSVQEKLKECFKPRYHLRRVKNKGAILVIVWSFLVSATYTYIGDLGSYTFNNTVFVIIQAIVGFTLPVAGWIADVRFGRYIIINLSLWTMWFSSLLLTVGKVILQLLDLHNNTYGQKTLAVLLVPLGIGFGGFQANIIQFGVDQLYDSSSDEIMAFVTWYWWTFLGSISIITAVLAYVHTLNFKYEMIVSLLICINLTLTVGSNFIFKNVLIMEPNTQNPLKLVYGVIKYAIKHKCPRQRSAFTYCEIDPPSRIDLGKHKYGGPFTTEQVEDVKTLFRIVLVLLMGCLFYCMAPIIGVLQPNIRNRLTSALSHPPTYIFSNFNCITVLLVIPLNEVFIHPLFNRCLQQFNSFKKFLTGAMLRFVWCATLLTLITYARYNYIHKDPHPDNVTLPCVFHDPNFLSNILDYKWSIGLEVIFTTSDLFLAVGGIGLYCAQVPYSMKGLVAGILYGSSGLFIMLFQVSSLPYTLNSIAWSTGTLSCSFWHILTLLIYMIVIFAAFVLLAKWYKRRKREDVLPNEHIFAEAYYSHNS